MITHGSTFSGIGAPEVAAEMLGWENVFHCEINSFGRRVLDYYFPNAKSYEDITKTDFSEWRDRITVLTGGFPCQPFSLAGKRRGSEDDRYLWPFMFRCIEQVRPRWFVGENVAGITTMEFPNSPVAVGEEADLFGDNKTIYELRQQLVLSEIIESLVGVGYSVQPFVIPACAVNAPHRRDRVFIVAHKNAEDTDGIRRESGADEVMADEQRQGNIEPTGDDGLAANTPSQRRREIYEQVQSKLADGEKSIGIGREWNVTDTTNKSWNNGKSGFRASIETQVSKFGECFCLSNTDINGLLPEQRWRTFPSVSPVYRGNDGLPFHVDNLTIPFSKWKNESLKAYGNAIVPQVMYEIFRIIDEIEKTNT